MSRFLFVVLPLVGHIHPANAVARVLTAHGHEVAWVGSQARLRPLIGPDATVYPTGMRVHRGQLDTGIAATKSLWEDFVVPFALFTLPKVDKAVEAFQPDVVVADQHAFAGPVTALRYDIPFATLATSSMEITEPYLAQPKVHAWIRGHSDRIWAAAGLPGPAPDLRFSPHLVIAFVADVLCPDRPGLASCGHFALVGPALSGRAQAEVAAGSDFPWEWLDPGRRHVLVTVGTLAIDLAADPAGFYARAVQALRPLADRAQAIIVAPDELIADPPDHVFVAPRVPVLELMPHLDAVVCHGGMNTVCEALNHGVPLVVAPIRHDQPINAAQVARLGAGIRVKFGRVRPDQLRAAVTSVLDDPAYRIAAGRVRDCLAGAGGAELAAELLERLAANDKASRAGSGPADGERRLRDGSHATGY
jgi:UDP:flavonoid glycosyltransferase YjiC (YdhE family)